jgi:glycosyltransferase involved in cell wall biosynthesis
VDRDPAPPHAPRLSLVVPCFREEHALAAIADEIGRWPGDEILFVDDGSDDGTGEALARIATAHPRARVLRHAQNRGVGAAMRTGIAASRGAVVVVYDADRTYPLADVERLAAEVERGADLATATPFGPRGAVAGVSAPRRLLTRLARLAWRLAVGRSARRVGVFTCAFRAYAGDEVRGLAWKSDGFAAAAEMLGLALLAGWRVVEVPSALSARREGRSKMRVGRAVLGHLAALGRVLGARAGRPAG